MALCKSEAAAVKAASFFGAAVVFSAGTKLAAVVLSSSAFVWSWSFLPALVSWAGVLAVSSFVSAFLTSVKNIDKPGKVLKSGLTGFLAATGSVWVESSVLSDCSPFVFTCSFGCSVVGSWAAVVLAALLLDSAWLFCGAVGWSAAFCCLLVFILLVWSWTFGSFAWKNKVKPGNVAKLGFLLESEIAPVSFALVLLLILLFCLLAVLAALSFEDVVVVLSTASVDGECNTPPPYGLGSLVLTY